MLFLLYMEVVKIVLLIYNKVQKIKRKDENKALKATQLVKNH